MTHVGKRPIGTVSVHARHVDVVMAEAREEKEIVAYMSLGIVTACLADLHQRQRAGS